MNFFARAFFHIATFSLAFSCSQKPAQIVDRTKAVYGQKYQGNKAKYKNSISKESLKSKDLAPIAANKTNSSSYKIATPYGNEVVPVEVDKTNKNSDNKKSENHKPTQVEVAAKDTLLSISKKYQVTLRDLIRQNNLTPPYNLKVGSKLTIPSPNYHEVKQGETLYSISRIYNMKINDLIEMNDLKEPYAVKLGEKLRVERFSDNTSQTTITTPESKKIVTPTFTTPTLATTESKPNVVEPNLEEKISDKSNHFSWPIKGEILSNFGPKKGGLHNDGINIKAKEGSDVKAAEDGVVAYVGNELKGYGNLIIVKHSSGWITAYAHLKNSNVSRGQKVKKGEKIATVGSSGNVSSPQLYFGLRKGRDAVNPQNYLR